MKFTKMQGLGNDYIYLDCTERPRGSLSKIAARISDRHFGVGADGLIALFPSDIADARMEIYNADGSRAEMCGNGIRCAGKFLYESGRVHKTRFSIETLAGVKDLELHTHANTVISVTVNMGKPEFLAEKIPVRCKEGRFILKPLVVCGEEYRVTCVSMGNPHAVVFLPEVSDLDLEQIGPHFERHERFPERINTEFVRVVDRRMLSLRVWERGSGETLACGTGACAALAAGVLTGLCERDVAVRLAGGELRVRWEETDGNIYMDGPAAAVFKGEYMLPESLRKGGAAHEAE